MGGLLKTPSTVEAESEGRKSLGVSGTSGTLSQEMASGFIERRMPTLLKTPSTVETEGGVMEIRPGCDGHYKLRDQIAMLPTPRQADGDKGIRSPEGHAKERERRGNGVDLPTSVGTRPGLKLQPAFVEWMMGFPLGFTDIEFTASKRSGTPSSPKSRMKSSVE